MLLGGLVGETLKYLSIYDYAPFSTNPVVKEPDPGAALTRARAHGPRLKWHLTLIDCFDVTNP